MNIDWTRKRWESDRLHHPKSGILKKVELFHTTEIVE